MYFLHIAYTSYTYLTFCVSSLLYNFSRFGKKYDNLLYDIVFD